MKKIHLQESNNKEIAFVFSAPGRMEEEMENPVSGLTGKNLLKILDILGLDNDLKNYTITNATDKVYYKTETNKKTEASVSEIIEKENIERLTKELKDIEKYVFFFGNKARSASFYLTNLKAKFVFAPHLSPRAFSHIKIFESEKNTKEEKLKLTAKYINKQL